MSEFPAISREERGDGSYIEWIWREWVIHFDTPDKAHEEWNKLRVGRVYDRGPGTAL